MEALPISDRLRRFLEVQYELIRPLGAGGMGVVILAVERALERRVAIKVLREEVALDEALRLRFRREARTIAQLTHPHIVPLYTFGEVEGEMYFVMAYVEGETLASRLQREGRLDVSDARRLLAELADALEHAHRLGVVHRDVKPENILLDARTGRALLTDFGIARDVERDTRLTATGILIGTPQYMSPEQALGESDVDGRSDLYSLGVVGYRALSGGVPFAAASLRELVAQHVNAAPAPLPKDVLESDSTIAGILARSMAKDRADRWPTAAAMQNALRASAEDDTPVLDPLADVEGSGSSFALTGLAILPLTAAGWVLGIRLGTPTDHLVAGLLTVSAMALGALARIGLAVHRSKSTLRATFAIAMRPPRGWKVWWPKRWRRRGDVWDRMPATLRTLRANNFFGAWVFLPTVLVTVLWLATPAGQDSLLGWLAQYGPTRAGKVVTGIAAGMISYVTLFAVLAARLQLRFGLTSPQLAVLQTLGNVDVRWGQDRFARILAANDRGVTVALPKSVAELLSELERLGVQVPEGIPTAVAAAERAIQSVDRELRDLRELEDPDEMARVEKRLAALGTGDQQLRQMLASQKALLVRAEARGSELRGLQQRVRDQLVVLRQQLVALRRHAPHAPEAGEITAQLRAVNDELRRLADGYDELSGGRERTAETI